MRFGLGPVFAYERLVNARRWQTYATRSFAVTALLVAMGTIATSDSDLLVGNSAQDYAKLGESYFYALVGVELALVMLAAPAATSTAICLDRARGTLAHVMATDLSDSEIVLGKLAARLLPVMGLVACTWPVMAISTFLGGIDPTALTMAFAIIVSVALLSCAIALALSVWAKKPHEVVLATYVFWALFLMAWPIWYALSLAGILSIPGHWLLVINPFCLAFAPYWAPGRFDVWDYAWFFALSIVTSGVLVWLAIWRLRPVTRRLASESRTDSGLGLIGRMGRWLPGPSLDGNPVLWREWHRSRPSLWMTILVAFLGGTTGLACCIGAVTLWKNGVTVSGMPGPAQVAGIFGLVIQLTLGLLMLSVLAPLSLSEERQCGSLDVLIATPLSTAAIVLGKWWGTFRLVPMLAIGPGLMCFALATARRVGPTWVWTEIHRGYLIGGTALVVVTVLVHGAAITSVGLALATWMKRQARAIVASVGVFLLVAVAWPILASYVFRDSQGLCSLSPIVIAGEMTDLLATRSERLRDIVWWIGYWDTGVAAFAIGLLWLTWRTFDLSLGRIPERARTPHVLEDAVVVLAGTTAASCLYSAVTIWVRGIVSQSLTPPGVFDVLNFVVLVLLSLLLVSAVSPLSISAALARDRRDTTVASPRSARSMVLTEWWRLFRLMSFLALGPSLIALALATAPTITVFHNRWELSLSDRLWSVALLVLMIVAFGGATIGAGLALGTWMKRRAWAVAFSIGLFLPIAVLSLLLGPGILFTQLYTREPQLGGIGGWTIPITLFLAHLLVAILLLLLTVWTLDRRYRPQRQGSVLAERLPFPSNKKTVGISTIFTET